MINHLKKENGILLEQLNKKCNKLIAVIEQKNKKLNCTIEQQKQVLKNFLDDDQITALTSETRTIREWSPEAIIKGYTFFYLFFHYELFSLEYHCFYIYSFEVPICFRSAWL